MYLDSNHEIKTKNFKIFLSYTGEGYDGDYNHLDPEDRPLLRCSILQNINPGEPIHNGSFCTLIPINTSKVEIEKFLNRMADDLEDLYKTHGDEGLGLISRKMAIFSYASTDKNGIINYK